MEFSPSSSSPRPRPWAADPALLAGVIVALFTFAGLDRLIVERVTDQLVATLVACCGAIAVATLARWRTIAPFVARQADLQVRYGIHWPMRCATP